MNVHDTLVLIMELMGTVAFAASGAMVGIRKNMDIFGVWVLGVTTSVGGGLIRDLILGITPPGMFRKEIYIEVASVTTLLVFLLFCWRRKILHRRILHAKMWGGGEPEVNFKKLYEQVMLVMDSIGLGIFTVVGVSTGIRCGYRDKVLLLVFVGTMTGVGGGVTRDVLAGDTPYIFAHDIYASASILGSLAYIWMVRYLGDVDAMMLAAAFIVLVRYMAVRYHWNLPRPKEK